MASKKYKDMTRPERRVAIAKDVIESINAGRIGDVMNGFGYVTLDCDAEDDVKRKAREFNKENAKSLMPYCTVCARGAMMLCKIAKFNDSEIDLLRCNHHTTADVLVDAFSETELTEIETAFERWGDSAVENEIVPNRFGNDFLNPEDRLIAICQNIIDHKGKFNPKCRYVML